MDAEAVRRHLALNQSNSAYVEVSIYHLKGITEALSKVRSRSSLSLISPGGVQGSEGKSDRETKKKRKKKKPKKKKRKKTRPLTG